MKLILPVTTSPVHFTPTLRTKMDLCSSAHLSVLNAFLVVLSVVSLQIMQLRTGT